MTSSEMKLYVWLEPHGTSYGSCMVFAIAESLPKARKLAMSKKSTKWRSCSFENDDAINMCIEKGVIKKLGKPDRVVKIPCAEWHEWSE